MRNRRSCSGSFLGLLFLLFLILKLAHVIEWSWWWVTSPLWLPVALTLGGLLVVGVLGITGYKVFESMARKRGQQTTGAQRQAIVEAPGTEVKAAPASGSADAGAEG